MHCTSYTPVHCRLRDNVFESGISWRPFSSDANNGKERGNVSSFPLFDTDQNLDLNKEVFKQIIQKHEATFKHQLQELHRLYRRQKELMDEIRGREVFARHVQVRAPKLNHLPSQAQSEIPQTAVHTASWILGNGSDNMSVLTTKDISRPVFIAENYQDFPISGPCPLLNKDSYIKHEALSSRSKGGEMRLWGLQLTANMYHGTGEGKQSEEANISNTPPQDSELGLVKMEDVSTTGLKRRNRDSFIDLNEPITLEPLVSSSSSSFDLYECHKNMMPNDSQASGMAEPNYVAPKHSARTNLSVAIDLNSVPHSCLSEADKFEELKIQEPEEGLLLSMSKQHCSRKVPFGFENEMPYAAVEKAVLDSSSVHNHSLSEGMCAKGDPGLGVKINNKPLRINSQVDLNPLVILEETFPSLSSADTGMKSAGETYLEAPVSPENKEVSPPRGESEDILLDSTLLTALRKRDSEIELDRIAVETLLTISRSRVQVLESENWLCWFADIVSSTCNDNDPAEVMDLQNGAVNKDTGIPPLAKIHDSKIKKVKISHKNAANMLHVVKKEKDIESLPARSVRDRATKDVRLTKSLCRTGSMKRNTRRNLCAKPRKSKLSHSDANKPAAANLKEPNPVVRGWGQMKKRQGGRRHRTSKFLVIS